MSDAKQITDQELKQIFEEYKGCGELNKQKVLQNLEQFCSLIEQLPDITTVSYLDQVDSKGNEEILESITNLFDDDECENSVYDKLGFEHTVGPDGESIINYSSDFLSETQIQKFISLTTTFDEKISLEVLNFCPNINLVGLVAPEGHDSTEP